MRGTAIVLVVVFHVVTVTEAYSGHVVSVGALTALPVLGIPVRLPAAPWNVVVAFWFFVGLATLVSMCQQATILAPIAYVGRQSIVFYLAHWPIVLFSVRILADSTGLSAWSIAGTSLAVAAVGTTALALASERVPAVRALFEWPSRGTRLNLRADSSKSLPRAAAQGRPGAPRTDNSLASPGGDS